MPHRTPTSALRFGFLILLATAASSAWAQTSYRCVGKDGKKYYGQTIPPQCVGLETELLNKQGVVTRRIEAQMSESERAAKEAAEKKKKEETAAAKDEERRNRALLATYTNERDIDEARIRSLADNEKALKEIEVRIGTIKKRQGDLDKEMEFYKGKNSPPGKLLQDVKLAQTDFDAQTNLLNGKKKDVEAINQRYDEDKRRFRELTKKR